MDILPSTDVGGNDHVVGAPRSNQRGAASSRRRRSSSGRETGGSVILPGPHADKESRLEKPRSHLNLRGLKIEVSCSGTPLV